VGRDPVPEQLLQHLVARRGVGALLGEGLPQLVVGLDQLAEAIELVLDDVELSSARTTLKRASA